MNIFNTIGIIVILSTVLIIQHYRINRLKDENSAYEIALEARNKQLDQFSDLLQEEIKRANDLVALNKEIENEPKNPDCANPRIIRNSIHRLYRAKGADRK